MALRAGRVGVNPADVNPIDGHIIINEKDGEHLIGYLNGIAVYENIITFNTPSTAGNSAVVGPEIPDVEEVLSISGIVYSDTNQFPINLYLDNNNAVSAWYNSSDNKIKMLVRGTGNLNKPVTCFIRYTKASALTINTLNEE